MTPTELISAIDIIRNSKLEDIKGRINIESNSSFFIVVYKDGIVKRQSNVSFVFSGDFIYAIIIVDFGYMTQNVWSKNTWEFAGFITPNSVISSIKGANWSITDISFGFTPHGYKAPSLKIKLNDDLSKGITYSTQPDKFENAWKLFEELNEHCNTIESATLYLKYFDECLKAHNQQLSIEQYKTELANKDSIINQYKYLLNIIEEKFNCSE
jgi:hypothetical protein